MSSTARRSTEVLHRRRRRRFLRQTICDRGHAREYLQIDACASVECSRRFLRTGRSHHSVRKTPEMKSHFIERCARRATEVVSNYDRRGFFLYRVLLRYNRRVSEASDKVLPSPTSPCFRCRWSFSRCASPLHISSRATAKLPATSAQEQSVCVALFDPSTTELECPGRPRRHASPR